VESAAVRAEGDVEAVAARCPGGLDVVPPPTGASLAAEADVAAAALAGAAFGAMPQVSQ
jgi:hypothetical protein